MSFSFTKTHESVFDGMRYTSGTYTNAGGSTGGDIRTGLEQIQGIMLQPKAAAVVAAAPVVNENLPVRDPVTIVTGANEAGYWFAFGY